MLHYAGYTAANTAIIAHSIIYNGTEYTTVSVNISGNTIAGLSPCTDIRIDSNDHIIGNISSATFSNCVVKFIITKHS